MQVSRMGLRQIEAFRAIMTLGSMTSAAKRLHTSQPQISRLIAQLEAITQFPLFERKGSRLTPTVDGARFFQEVEKTFLGLAVLESAAASIRSFAADRLRVAAMPRLAGGLLARVVAQFKIEYPEVLVSIHSGNAGAVHDWISSGFCDMGLAMLYEDTPGVQVEPVFTADCVAVLPREHRLCAKKALTPQDFAGEPFISFPTASPLRSSIDEMFTEAGVDRKIVAEASLGSSICALVGAGLGVSLLNPLTAREERIGGIEIRRFSPSIPTIIGLLFPPTHARTRLVSVFASCARDVMRKELAFLSAKSRVSQAKRRRIEKADDQRRLMAQSHSEG